MDFCIGLLLLILATLVILGVWHVYRLMTEGMPRSIDNKSGCGGHAASFSARQSWQCLHSSKSAASTYSKPSIR